VNELLVLCGFQPTQFVAPRSHTIGRWVSVRTAHMSAPLHTRCLHAREGP
jgi:hypothetical protein